MIGMLHFTLPEVGRSASVPWGAWLMSSWLTIWKVLLAASFLPLMPPLVLLSSYYYLLLH
jgi:hypothetical protein